MRLRFPAGLSGTPPGSPGVKAGGIYFRGGLPAAVGALPLCCLASAPGSPVSLQRPQGALPGFLPSVLAAPGNLLQDPCSLLSLLGALSSLSVLTFQTKTGFPCPSYEVTPAPLGGVRGGVGTPWGSFSALSE